MADLAAQLADRMADRIVGVRKPRVLSVASGGDGGRVQLTVTTDRGTVRFDVVEVEEVDGG